MRKLLLLALVASTSLFADIYHLKPLKVTKDIHCVIGDFNPPTKQNNGFVSNLCYIDMGDSIVILDAGPTYHFAKEFDALIQKTYPGKKISAVVLSNFHDDRILGAGYFQSRGAKIIAHKTIIDDIKEYQSKFDRIPMIVSKEVYKNTKLIMPDTLVEGGYQIKGRTKTLTILKPSNISEERSDIAIYSKEDSFLFVGNLVFNNRMLNYRKASSVDGWIKALETLAKLHATHIIAGHGNDHSKNSYKATLNYLKILKRDVKKAYDNEVDELELVSNVHTQQFKYLRFFDTLNYNAIMNYYAQLEWAE